MIIIVVIITTQFLKDFKNINQVNPINKLFVFVMEVKS